MIRSILMTLLYGIILLGLGLGIMFYDRVLLKRINRYFNDEADENSYTKRSLYLVLEVIRKVMIAAGIIMMIAAIIMLSVLGIMYLMH